ncbi:MAG: peptidoglycan DD-metalloendopeptidase family protein [Desulfocapsa sp.]|nr:peptidoglycan DD-metalloendopeptidase family protein [Desulfocapsa sp.]
MFFSSTHTQHFGTPPCKHIFVLFSCVLFVFLIGPSICLSKTDRKTEKQQIEKGIRKYHININKLQGGITSQKGQIESSAQKQRNLFDELILINARLFTQLKKLRGFEEQVNRQEELITKKEVELQSIEASKQNVQNHLQERIKAYYKMGEIGIANVAFSTKSMPQILQFRDSFASLIAYDKSLLDEYRKSIDTLQRAQVTLSLEKGVLNDLITFAKEEQEATNTIKLEKEALFNQIKTQKELHEQAVKEMEKVADNLTSSLNALKRKNKLFDQGFLLNKGKHPVPIPGKVIARFGEEHNNRLGISRKTTGITIATQGTNKVYAIFEGEVSYADYLYGYGNTIIIDHGFQYFSITSRVEKLLVKEGDRVAQGDTIALTGDTATLMDEGIYLEIRQGSKPLDPLQWLDNNDLILP